MTLLKTIKGKLPGVNLYKLGAILVLVLAWTAFVHQRATHKCELAFQQQQTEEAQEETVEVVKHVEARVPVISKKQESTAKLHAEINYLHKKLEEAIHENENRTHTPACNLSDAEFSRMRELIQQSREAAN